MKNLIASCSNQNAMIFFVDNVYMYDPDHVGNMTEKTPIRIISEKGKVRTEVSRILISTVERKNVTALGARGADFNGQNVQGSLSTQSVYNNLLKNKNPQWIGKLEVLHSFNNTKDIGKALALLGNTPDAYNQVWHLPTTDEKLTSRQWIELMMKAINKQKRFKPSRHQCWEQLDCLFQF